MSRLAYIPLALFLLATVACKPSAPPEPHDLEVAGKTYRARIVCREQPVPLHSIHEWEIHLTRADGSVVSDARIEVNGGMPAHEHGLPTVPRVSGELAPGRYLLEGMKFSMPGHWTLTLAISEKGADEETVTFDLYL